MTRTPNWENIFSKDSHTFTEHQIEAAGNNDFAPLAKLCPKFWKKYKTGEKNPDKLEKIWDLEYDWYEAVRTQDFEQAKQLYEKLKKVSV